MIQLPYPPSINRMYRTWRGRMLLSKEGREYYAFAVPIAATQFNGDPYKREVYVIIHMHLPDNRRRDTDNILKCTFDTLKRARIIEDDHWIWHHEVIKYKPDGNPRLMIEIRDDERTEDGRLVDGGYQV